MDSNRDIYKTEFMQQIPREYFKGSDSKYNERMEMYISSRSNSSSLVILVDFVLAGGNLSSTNCKT